MKLNKIIRYGLFFFLIISHAAWADQLIIEPDMGEQPLINAINNAHHSIHLVMYGFTDKKILKALTKQAKNRSIKVILERNPYRAKHENDKTIQQLNAHQIEWHGFIPSIELVHQKTLILDAKKAIVMTFNFTHSTFRKERNFALLIDDPSVVNDIEALFSADWNHQSIHLQSPNLILSPDNSRKKLLGLINGAKRNIKIYAQTINDYQIVGALAKAARRNVSVNIITSANMPRKKVRYLTRAGVKIYFNSQYIIHAKVMMIDDQKAILGSINLTRSSIDDNRELAVITQDHSVINLLNTTFNRDMINSTSSSIQN